MSCKASGVKMHLRLYKCRWLIELYFKWMKQQLRTVKLHSYKPQAIWNQLFLILITAWRVLQLLRVYMYHPWSAFEEELYRKPSKTSKGRPRASDRKATSLRTSIGEIRSAQKR
ncbi:transposase [Paenibacillus sp. BR2-3]|uniref:transposase n=1 Tax=Paenibacillus sp. BR2-3 TaxID=3048494 RepID=UPI003977AA51